MVEYNTSNSNIYCVILGGILEPDMGGNCRCTVTLLAVAILERLNEKPILHPMQLNSQGRGIPMN